MKIAFVLCVAACVALPATVSARGMGMHGMGMHAMSGGAFGTSATAPGTNSLGTALSSDGTGRAMKDLPSGTDAAIAKEDTQLDKMLEGSICRGC